MLVPVRGVLVIEDEQTGDGRYIVAGGLTWQDPPLPFAWAVGGDQHVDLLGAAPQIGTIDAITRVGAEVQWTGAVDDEIPEGGELVRRMRAGSAAYGNRFGISIDPDDWALDVIDTTEQINAGETAAPIVASLSGAGVLPLPTLNAAAGDGDPSGVVVYSDASDMWVQRFTRLRIRGVTAVSVPAFAGAYVELADAAPAADATPPADQPVEQPAAEGARVVVLASAPARPPAEWFHLPEPELGDERLVEQFDRAGNPIGFAVPLTIDDDGRYFFGHLAASWDQCHVGYGQCVSPPASASAYAHFHTGEVLCDDGSRVATGPMVVGCDHAAATALAPAARDHYANAGLAWGDARVIDGQFAPWVCGAVRPGLDDATLRVLRATVLSGDWRRLGTGLDLVSILSVNNPGFPVARSAIAASALPSLAAASTAAHVVDGVQMSLVAAAPALRCVECQKRLMDDNHVGGDFARVERMLSNRTAHLIPAARDSILADIRGR